MAAYSSETTPSSRRFSPPWTSVLKDFVTGALGIAVLLVVFGFVVGSYETMPTYAVVFLDDANNTYIALPCLDEWQSRKTQTVDMVRRSTAGEARKLGYNVDAECRDDGGYVEQGRSLAGMMLVWLGVLPPLKHWWDMPYRTEGGTIYPHDETTKDEARRDCGEYR